MKDKIMLSTLALGQFLSLGGKAFAQGADTPTSAVVINTSCSDMSCVMGKVGEFGGYLLWAAGGLAIIFLIIGGIRYLVSAGNSTQTEAAKKTIIYALVGLVIVILSATIVGVLTSFLG